VDKTQTSSWTRGSGMREWTSIGKPDTFSYEEKKSRGCPQGKIRSGKCSCTDKKKEKGVPGGGVKTQRKSASPSLSAGSLVSQVRGQKGVEKGLRLSPASKEVRRKGEAKSLPTKKQRLIKVVSLSKGDSQGREKGSLRQGPRP